MCWYSADRPERLVAKQDIVCYKIFDVNCTFYKYKKFLGIPYKRILVSAISPYFKFIYEPYKKYNSVELEIIKTKSWIAFFTFRIKEGYHSFVSLKTVIPFDLEDFYIVKCIIPKNSIYYTNQREYVSSDIIVTDEII